MTVYDSNLPKVATRYGCLPFFFKKKKYMPKIDKNYVTEKMEIYDHLVGGLEEYQTSDKEQIELVKKLV
jgi:hypothetical protein